MEVCEQSEAWVEKDEDWAFSHTKIILKRDGQYFYAISTHRYRSATDISLVDLEPIPILASNFWPEYPKNFKQAPTPISENCYVKRPSLLYYGDTVSQETLQQHLDSLVHVVISEYRDNPRSIVESVCAVAYRLRFRQPNVAGVLRNSKFELEDGILVALILAAQRLLRVDTTGKGITIQTQRHLEAKRAEDFALVISF